MRPTGRWYCVDDFDVAGDHTAALGNCNLYTGLAVSTCGDTCLNDPNCFFFVSFDDGECAVKTTPMTGGCGSTFRNDAVARTCFRVY